jgi:hypothetical protein
VRRISLVGAGVLVVTLVVLGVAQLVLPGIAAQRLRDRLERSGTVLRVEIDAFPAIELLWHRADKVVVRMASYSSSAAKLSSTLNEVADTGSLDASARRLVAGLLTLRDATLRKRGDRLTAGATVTESDLRSSFPVLDGVQPVASSSGQLTLQGTATVLGVTVTADATVRPENGSLVVDAPFGLATLTLFSSPRIAVEGVAAAAAPGGFALTGTARLR